MTGDAFLTGAADEVGGASRVDAQALVLDQAFDPDSLHALRAALQAHAQRIGLPEELAGDVVLALHELAANAIAHGAGHGRLRLWQLPGALRCEISDDGRASQPGLPAQPGAPAHSGPQAQPGRHVSTPPLAGATDQAATTAASFPVEAGHGLWLARQVAAQLDLWSDEHGTRAVITFELPPPA